MHSTLQVFINSFFFFFFLFFFHKDVGPVSWGYKIHWLHLYGGLRPPLPNKCSWYDSKSSNDEASVLEILGNVEKELFHCHYSQVNSGLE